MIIMKIFLYKKFLDIFHRLGAKKFHSNLRKPLCCFFFANEQFPFSHITPLVLTSVSNGKTSEKLCEMESQQWKNTRKNM